jgi:hypothetical protein
MGMISHRCDSRGLKSTLRAVKKRCPGHWRLVLTEVGRGAYDQLIKPSAPGRFSGRYCLSGRGHHGRTNQGNLLGALAVAVGFCFNSSVQEVIACRWPKMTHSGSRLLSAVLRKAMLEPVAA